MTVKIVSIVSIAFLVFSILSCKKNAIPAEPGSIAGLKNKTIKLTNVKFARNVIPNFPITYDEQACTVKIDTTCHIGTYCFESVGNTCSKPTNCVPLERAASSGDYTKEEINTKIKLIEKAYGVKYTY